METLSIVDQAKENLEKELRETFPDTRFFITSYEKSYKEGDISSLDICWHVGPARKEIDLIAKKYRSEVTFLQCFRFFSEGNETNTWVIA